MDKFQAKEAELPPAASSNLLAARTRAILFHPAAVCTLTFTGLWTVTFLGLLAARPGFVMRAAPTPTDPDRRVFAAARAAGIAAAVGLLGTGIPFAIQFKNRKRHV